MDLIYERTDQFGNVDSGYLAHFEADFDITTDRENNTNDFEIRMELPTSPLDLLYIEDEVSCIVYVEGTEFGGEITGTTSDVGENEVIYTGRTWRGTQDQYVIEPPAGQPYLILNGNLQACLRQFPMNSRITVDTSSQTVSNFKVPRYIKTFEGVQRLLAEYGLMDSYTFDDGEVKMTMAAPRNLSDLIDLSPDYGDHIRLRITRDGNTPQHLICLGQGELEQREVIHLYAGPPNWTISQTAVAGAYPVDVYDNTSTENLLKDGTAHYQELIANHRQIEADIYDLDLRLGDIITARDHISDECVEAEISKIVWQVKNFGEWQEEEYQYETKVRT